VRDERLTACIDGKPLLETAAFIGDELPEKIVGNTIAIAIAAKRLDDLLTLVTSGRIRRYPNWGDTGALKIRMKTYEYDVTSRQLLSRPPRDSETPCSLDDSLPGRAWLVTAGFGALGTMKSLAREEHAARRAQPLQTSGGEDARLDRMVNVSESPYSR
jgi:hypothetical protein